MPIRSLFLSLLLSFGLSLSSSYAAELVNGVPTVIAGNIIEIDGEQFYLNGLAMPHSDSDCSIDGKSCAVHSKQALVALVGGHALSCLRQEKSHGSLPTVACELAGKDLSTLAVAKGIALPFAENDLSKSTVEGASTTQAGLLALPSMRSLIEGLQSGATAPRDCAIKGNISRETGDKIYHLPSAAHYARTLIDPTRGERWFCKEEEAQASGFRRAAN